MIFNSNKKLLKKFINKYPRNFREISFNLLFIINFFLYFLLKPIDLFFLLFLNYFLLFPKKVQKLIIRDDNLGDSIITLPFIYGLIDKEQNNFYFSPILEKIFNQIQLKINWKTTTEINNNKYLLIANLSTSKISNFIGSLYSCKTKVIFTQINSNLKNKAGFPILFSPNYYKNKSQSYFIKSCLNRLQIKSDPILGLRKLNSHFENISSCKNKNLLIISLGLGVDIGRRISGQMINDIIKFSRDLSLIPIILEEPGFEKESKNIAASFKIKTKSCENYNELFLLFKESKLSIGYDCGPMHAASLFTNSIILFSHTPVLHWGKHIWHKQISETKLVDQGKKIFVIEQINRGSQKKNWLICADKKGCSFHKNSCLNNNCSNLDTELVKKSLCYIFNKKDNLN